MLDRAEKEAKKTARLGPTIKNQFLKNARKIHLLRKVIILYRSFLYYTIRKDSLWEYFNNAR